MKTIQFIFFLLLTSNSLSAQKTVFYTKNLDAYEDVYFKGGFTIVENREDKNVKDAIIETFNTDWNKNFIKREVEKNKKDFVGFIPAICIFVTGKLHDRNTKKAVFGSISADR